MTKWTPEPWRVEETDEGTYRVVDAQGKRVFSWSHPPAEEEVDRMVPCINALAGLNPEGVRKVVKVAEMALGCKDFGEGLCGGCATQLRTAIAAVRLKDV